MWLTMFYFTFAFITMYRYRKRDSIPDSESFWHGWKWISMLFTSAILWESVIASVYWTILFPEDSKRRLHTVGLYIGNFFDHLFPIVFLTIDFCLNRIYVEWN